MRDYTEKRDFIRMVLDCELRYTPLESGAGAAAGRARNLSGRGLMFIADQSFPAGSLMEVEIEPRQSLVPPLHAVIEVVRVEPDAEGGYRIGAEIREVKT